MKKITFLLLTIFLITFKTSAQDSKIKFGIQGGLNYSSFRGYDSFFDEKPGFAYLFGVSFEYGIKNNLSIKADLNYERKTQTSKGSVYLWDTTETPTAMPVIYDYKTTVYSNYIVLPIMLKYNFTDSNSFYVNGGPYLAYLLKSGIKSNSNAPGINIQNEETKNRKSLDYGISAGIGKEFKINENHNFYIELRENLGLANTAKGEVMNGDSIKTNSLNLIAGFKF